jgi:cytochrome c
MLKFVLFAALLTILIASVFVAACGGQKPTSTTTTTATTAGQQAVAGQTAFATYCARCHGDKGQGITGPTLIGTGNTLDKYGTAQALLNFIDTTMPVNAPGSLSQQDYLDILSYLLVQNNFVSSSTALDASNLNNVTLK